MRPLDYRILRENMGLKIMSAVEKWMKEGYVPQGGVTVTYNSNTKEYTWAQAMVKYDSQ